MEKGTNKPLSTEEQSMIKLFYHLNQRAIQEGLDAHPSTFQEAKKADKEFVFFMKFILEYIDKEGEEKLKEIREEIEKTSYWALNKNKALEIIDKYLQQKGEWISQENYNNLVYINLEVIYFYQ